jgi:NADH-quinone oxidoreductase subunit J
VSTVLFFLAGFGAIAGAVGVVVLRDPFFSVLALVAHLLSLAVLFLLLRAEFVAAVQVVVYAGAVMVLYVFVVAYIGGREEGFDARPPLLHGRSPSGSSLRLGGAVLGGALLVELLIALLGSGLKAIEGYGAGYAPGPRTFGTPAYIGNLLLTRFLLAFEIASFLLLIAAVGAVVLARRRGGLGEDRPGSGRHELTTHDLLRPRGTGTMAEGVTGLAFAAAHAGATAEEEHRNGTVEHPATVAATVEHPATVAGTVEHPATATVAGTAGAPEAGAAPEAAGAHEQAPKQGDPVGGRHEQEGGW